MTRFPPTVTNAITGTLPESKSVSSFEFLKLLVSDIRWNDLTEECRLMQLTTLSAKIRLTAEILMEIAAALYILAALREARFLGLNMFIENLVRPHRYFLFRLFFYTPIASYRLLIDSSTRLLWQSGRKK